MAHILSYLRSYESPGNMVKWKFEIPPSPGSFPPEEFCDFLGYFGSILELISALERRDDGGHFELS